MRSLAVDVDKDYSLCSQKVPVWPTWHLQKVPTSLISQLPCPLQGNPLGLVILLVVVADVVVVVVDVAAVARLTFAKQPSVGLGDMIRLINAGLHFEKFNLGSQNMKNGL